MLIMSHDADMIQKLKMELLKTFDMKDLGSAKRILGLEIPRDRKVMSILYTHFIPMFYLYF